MSQLNLIKQAEQLWLQLCNQHARAIASGDLSQRLRVEQARERAWWRLIRRLGLASKAARLGIKTAPASWDALERRPRL
jgi:hypothetical protein